MVDRQAQDSIDQAAIGWVMAVHDAPDDTALRDSLAAWLASDPAHQAAYSEIRRVWLLTGLLPPQADASAAPPVDSLERRSS
jgi:transmembrane sensor